MSLTSRARKSIVFSSIVFGIIFFLMIFYFTAEVKKARKMGKFYKKYITLCSKSTNKDRFILGSLMIPRQLQNIPLADKEGIILNTKKVPIRGVEAPYNASLIAKGNNYMLFFRYDLLTYKCTPPFHSYIGCCTLNQDFSQTGKEFITLNTQSTFSEDPRVIQWEEKNLLIYNDLVKDKVTDYRTIHLAQVDVQSLKIDYITPLDIQLQSVEKNWTPFSYSVEGEPKIHFEYYINPHKILKINDLTKNEICHMNYENRPPFQMLPWANIWGEPRGGTPAIKVDNQYLAFFHSFFTDTDGFIWYVMGAYTFADKEPFNITSISKYPILFQGIYDTMPTNSSNPIKRSIYPCGLVLAKKEEKDVLHVSCGENDSAIKIITFDKEKLIQSLAKIK